MWWKSSEQAENEIKREIMMNSQSVSKASFAPHESGRVWSQRECQAWPSRQNLARQSRRITDDLFHVQHNGFTSIIHASQVSRQEMHMYPKAPDTQREEKSRILQLGFRCKITMFSVPSHKWCLHSSPGLSLAAPRIHRRVKSLSPTIFYWGELISVLQWGNVKPFRR